MDPQGYACGLFRDLSAPAQVAKDLRQATQDVIFEHTGAQN